MHPAAVALLARLPRLRKLRIVLVPGRGAAATSVATALMPVVLGSPDLQAVRISWCQPDDGRPPRVNAGELHAAIKEGVEWMQQTLRQIGRNPELVGIH